jgi:hypothetical protein
MSTDVATITPFPVYQPGTDWETLEREADEVLGYDLLKDEGADDLVGVPFLITAVSFRPGLMHEKVRQAYVSCEVRITPNLTLRVINSRREGSSLGGIASLDSLAFGPDSHVVVNDGSTGIYRQIVKYLAAKRFITLKEPITEAGAYGESSFDQPPNQWAGIATGDTTEDDGFLSYSVPVRLACPRGLRLSQYEHSEYGQTKTRYLG